MTTGLPVTTAILLLLTIGVPGNASSVSSSKRLGPTLDQLACSANGLCTWRDDFDNKGAHWVSALDASVSSAASPASSHLCLVPSESPEHHQQLIGRFESHWIAPAKLAGSGDGAAVCLVFGYLLSPAVTTGPSLSLLKRNWGSCRTIEANQLGSGVFCQNSPLWKSRANTSPTVTSGVWSAVSVDILSGSDFKLIFEGTIPAGNPNARICVDNITAYHRPCHQIAASAYEASMRRWLEPIVFVFAGALASALVIVVVFFAIRVSRRRGKKSPSTGSGSDDGDGSVSPQRAGPPRRQQEAMLLHAERFAAASVDGSASSAAVGGVALGHGRSGTAATGPRRPAPPVPPAQPSLDELLASREPPPRYEEAMGLLGGGAGTSTSSTPSGGDHHHQVPPPHPPRVMRKSGGLVV